MCFEFKKCIAVTLFFAVAQVIETFSKSGSKVIAAVQDVEHQVRKSLGVAKVRTTIYMPDHVTL